MAQRLACSLRLARRERSRPLADVNRGHCDAQPNPCGRGSTEPPRLARGCGWPCHGHGSDAAGKRPGHDQSRHPSFALRHHGDQRDDAEGRHADAHRGAEQEGRPARQEARGGRRRSGFELAAVRRKGARAASEGQGRRRVRLLDLGLPQVGAAGVQGAQRHPVLPGPVRGRGERAQRVLHRRRAEPAGDPGRRLPDEKDGEGEALGARGHRLRLSAHHQQDPRSLSQVEGRRRTRTS